MDKTDAEELAESLTKQMAERNAELSKVKKERDDLINRDKIVRTKLDNGEPVIGGWCLSGSPVIAEAMAASFDFVVLDLEHGSAREFENCCRAIKVGGADPFVRIPNTHPIGPLLDFGAVGIIMSNVDTPELANALVAESMFPPYGTRSYSLARCSKYGRRDKDYYATANDDIVRVIMIESIDAVSAINPILSVERVDAIMIGPYDLSGSLGCPGDFKEPEYINAIDKVVGACKDNGVAFGQHDPHATRNTLQHCIRNGARFIAAGMDTTTLIDASDEMTRTLELKGSESHD